MACQAVHTWSLSGLVAAFVDLAIAYLLLCASAVAYLASNFLGFLGLNLPCPCDGMFLNINGKILFLNRLLVNFPTQKVSDVQLSGKQKLPFIDPKKHDYSVDGDYNCVNGILEMEGEASCSSVSDARWTVDSVRDVLGGEPYAHSSTKGENRFIEGSSLSVDNAEAHYLEYDNKDPTKMGVRQRSITGFELNHSPDANMHEKKIYIEELQDNLHGVQSLSGDEKNAVRLLKQTLEEERIARAALYIELEKERSAAASAADEAMAMILRLQEEKASIEIEARQYQRILEEKSAYDAEEMNILKEILVRNEKERHFLEMEVEAYRQMVSVGNERLESDDGPDKSVVITDKLNFEPAFENESSIRCQNERSSFGKQGDLDDNFVRNIQEKEIISADNKSQLASKGPEECKKPVPMNAKGLEQIQDKNLSHTLEEKIIVTCNGTETRDPYYDPSLKQESKDGLLEFSTSCDPMLDKGPHVYDVHIIGDEINFCSEASSEITCGLTQMKPRGLSSISEQRRSSLSAVESEMIKIDCEVGRLRERLKLVQEGRDKLSFCVESRERENIQLNLLEDIARQVREIRQLNDPGKTLRQVSLPLPTSKVLSKKRRSRSVSSGFQRSSEG